MAKRTYDVVQPLYGFTVADDCPLVVERGNFLRESGTNAVFLQLKLVNYGSEPIKTATLEGTVIDETGDPLPNGNFVMTYAEVNCEMLAAFGTKQLVPVIDVGRYALITRLEVEFASGFVQSWQGDFAHCCLRSRKVTVPELFRGAVGAVNKVLIEPAAVGATMHRCCCGALLGNSIPCPNCGRTADQAMYAVTRDGMEEALRKSGARPRPAQSTAQSAAKATTTSTMPTADQLLSGFKENFHKIDERKVKLLLVAGVVDLIGMLIVIKLMGDETLEDIWLKAWIGALVSVPVAVAAVLLALKEVVAAAGLLFFYAYAVYNWDTPLLTVSAAVVAAGIVLYYYLKHDLPVGKNGESGIVYKVALGKQCGVLAAVAIATVCQELLLQKAHEGYQDFFAGWGIEPSDIPATLISTIIYVMPIIICFQKKTNHTWLILTIALILSPLLYIVYTTIFPFICWLCYVDVVNSTGWGVTSVEASSTVGVGVTRGGKDTLAGLKLGGKLGTTGLVVGVGAAIVIALVLFGRQLDDFWYDLTGGCIMAEGLGTLGLVLVVLYFIPVVILFLKNAAHKWQIAAGAAVALAVFVFVIPNALLAVIAWLVVCWLCFVERRSYTLNDNNDITINIDRK